MKKQNCPYYDTYKKICTHKHNKEGDCINNNITKCELYIEWVKKNKNFKSERRNTSENTTTNDK